MSAPRSIIRLRQRTFAGVVLGGFAGLLFHKLALGMSLGFFAGVAIDAAIRRAAARDGQSPDPGGQTESDTDTES